MRLGLMQPYFFPYPGHFALIANTDSWVVFDTSQYTPKRWMNRNRVLREDSGWDWLTVAVRAGPSRIASKGVGLHDPARTRSLILGRLMHYRRAAPFAGKVIDLVADVLDVEPDATLVDLNVRSLSAVCSYLGIRFEPKRLSELDIEFRRPSHPGGWAPAVAAALGADEYLNPVGGAALFRLADFDELGVRPLLCHTTPLRYDTGHYCFEEGLSIVDALMWCPPTQIVDYLSSATVSPLDAPAESHVA